MMVSSPKPSNNLEILTCIVELAASFIVWSASPEAEFLKGKFIWSNWDVTELLAKKEELQNSPLLTLGLLGWP